jgi:hypothetical protein
MYWEAAGFDPCGAVTNYFDRVAQTELDFPKVPMAPNQSD